MEIAAAQEHAGRDIQFQRQKVDQFLWRRFGLCGGTSRHWGRKTAAPAPLTPASLREKLQELLSKPLESSPGSLTS